MISRALVTLGEIADLQWGDTSVTKKSYVLNGDRYPAYSASGQDGYLPYFDYDRIGVVLSAIGANAGKTWLATGKWSCIKNTIRFFSIDESVADTRYLFWATQAQGTFPLRGSAQPFISQGDARKVTIDLPPIEEQRAIAATLGALDDKIESNRRATAVGESLIRALVESALDASEGADGTLGDYCRLVKAPVKVEEISADDNYIGLEHMPRGSIFLTEWEKAEGLGSNKTAFQRGDVLFGKLRPYFKKVGIAPVNGVCSTDILAVRPKDPRDLALIAVVAASDALIDSLSAGSTGTRMPRASWKDLAAWQVPVLTSTERAELSDRVAPLVDRLEQLTFESRRLAALRDALLPELLSGRLRASVGTL